MHEMWTIAIADPVAWAYVCQSVFLGALEVSFNDMRYINSRFTYLLTYLLTYTCLRPAITAEPFEVLFEVETLGAQGTVY